MPDADQPDASTMTVEGIHIEKRLERDRFPIPTVEFTIRSERDEPTEFHLIDEIPESIPMENVGFHPEYGSQHWTAYENHHVRFDRVLDPGEEVTTVYGIRTDGALDETALLAEPVVKIPGTDTVGALDRLDDDDIDELLNDVLEDDEPLSDLLDEGSPMAPGLEDEPTEADESAATETADTTPAGDDDPLSTEEGTAIDLNEEPGEELLDESADIEDADIGESIDLDAEANADGESTEGEDEPLEDLEVDDADTVFEGTEQAETTESAGGDADPFGDAPESESEPTSGTGSPLATGEDDTQDRAGADDDGAGVDIDIDAESAQATDPIEETDTTQEPVDESELSADRSVESIDTVAGGESTAPVAGGGDDEGTTADPAAVADGELVAALAEEIRSGSADQADVETLADHLDEEIARSRDVRLRHVQSRVDDLSAYIDALEEFIDDNGTAAELIEDFEAEVDDLRDDLVDLEGTVETVADSQTELTDQLDEVESQLDAVEAELESATVATEKLDTLESQMESTTGNVDGMTDDIESMKSELSALSEDVGSVANEMEELQTDLTDRVESVESELDTITDRLDALESWRDQLKSALGPN
ncbi:MAG: hypothetical protein ABEI76_10320 [Halobacteriales archaeon]